jgi:chromosome segregation ATPase
MSAVAELQQGIEDLEAQHDKLARAVERGHQELDRINTAIGRRTAVLEQIESKIKQIKARYGVQS